MGKRVGIAKAAKILGVKRTDLNHRLVSAGIETFEGEVDIESIQRVAPSMSMGDPAILERVQYIRENCAKQSESDQVRRPAEELTCQVRRLTTELMIESRKTGRYLTIIDGLIDKLAELQESDDECRCAIAFELNEWLAEKIRE